MVNQLYRSLLKINWRKKLNIFPKVDILSSRHEGYYCSEWPNAIDVNDYCCTIPEHGSEHHGQRHYGNMEAVHAAHSNDCMNRTDNFIIA